MTLEQVDVDYFDGTINGGESRIFTVETQQGDRIGIFIDDGTTDGVPARYNMTQRVYQQELDDYQLWDNVVNETARSWWDPSPGARVQVEVENDTNNTESYRIVVKSFREMD